MPHSGIRVVLYHGGGLIGKAIRWQTRSIYSHAALMLPDGSVIEAWHRGGVLHNFSMFTVHERGTVADIFGVNAPLDHEAAEFFAQRQVGEAYDFGSVLRFVSRRQESRNDSGKWFCSELVFAAIAKGGVKLLERTEPWAVSPGLLACSPLLVKLSQEVKP